jgi:hypothetical protein
VVDDKQEHRGDADHEAGEYVDRDHPEERCEREPELEALQLVVAAHLGELPQVRDRVDDQRGEYRLGQVLEQRGEHEHRDQDQDQHRRDQGRDL